MLPHVFGELYLYLNTYKYKTMLKQAEKARDTLQQK